MHRGSPSPRLDQSHSDSALGEGQKKWRGRIVHAGNTSIETIERCDQQVGMSKEQIEYLQGELIKTYADVPLI